MADGVKRRIGLLALMLTAIGTAAVADGPIVVTESGEVQGQTRDGVSRFLGLPYAVPPVGDLRWRAPRPAPVWTGRRDATAFGPDCPQPPMDRPPGPGFVNPTGEDCLFLNIWRPEDASDDPMPVMVWIHGGAFIMGAGSWPTYDGAAFARGGVVLVTINYRLGRLGFFAHPALGVEAGGDGLGAYGLMDQIAALAWVRRNIAAFGGNAANVTVFGESAGGRSVNMLLTSPLAAGLFDKAIVQSGGGQNRIQTLAEAEATGADWARSVTPTDEGDVLAALRALPIETVARLDFGRWPLPAPMIDGRVLPTQIDEAFIEGRTAPVPYLAGANSWEESLLRWLPGAAEAKLAGYGAFTEPMLALYAEEGRIPREAALERWYGEAAYVGPARFAVARMAALGRPAWLYQNAYVAKAARDRVPGAAHGSEVSLVFRNEATPAQFGESEQDTPMAALMNAYWIEFARKGDPNRPGLPEWPTWSEPDRALMLFDNEGARAMPDFAGERLDLLDRAFEASRRPEQP